VIAPAKGDGDGEPDEISASLVIADFFLRHRR
jgi:hypothetical protein